LRNIALRSIASLRSIICAASIDCAEIFARNAKAAHRSASISKNLVLTLRNRGRYKDHSGAPLGAPLDSLLKS